MCNFMPFVRRAILLSALAAVGVLASDRPLSADSFDWRNVNGQNWVTSVKDQGGAGTCWDFAGCGILEAKYMLTRNDTTYQPDVSEQQLCCAGVGSISGGNAYNVDNYAISTGIVLESELPYTQQNSSPQWPLSTGWGNRVFKATADNTTIAQGTNIDTIKNCLKGYGPLTLHCVVPGDWYNLQDGSGSGNHEVVIVGYHDNLPGENAPGGGYWIIKNSWGSWWNGDGNHNGYGEIAYASAPDFYDPAWYEFWLPDNHYVTGLTGQVYFTGAMATVTWKGGSADWTAGGNNWGGSDMYGNSLPTYSWQNRETTAIFNTAGGNVNLSGTVIAHGVTVNAGATGYWFNGINGGALTVTGGGITANEDTVFNVPISIGAPQTWTVASGHWLTVCSDVHTIISGLTVYGPGRTVIDGSIDGGGAANAVGMAAGGITINGGAYLYLRGSGWTNYYVNTNIANGGLAFQPPTGTSSNYWGTISGGGYVDKWGGGTAILSGGNNYSNWTSIYDGAIQADSGAGLPSGSFLNLNGGVLQSNGAVTFTRSLGTGGGDFPVEHRRRRLLGRRQPHDRQHRQRHRHDCLGRRRRQPNRGDAQVRFLDRQ